MPKKASRPAKFAPLQRVTAEPITDPAEQADIDKMRKRLKCKQGGPKAKTNRENASPAAKA